MTSDESCVSQWWFCRETVMVWFGWVITVVLSTARSPATSQPAHDSNRIDHITSPSSTEICSLQKPISFHQNAPNSCPTLSWLFIYPTASILCLYTTLSILIFVHLLVTKPSLAEWGTSVFECGNGFSYFLLSLAVVSLPSPLPFCLLFLISSQTAKKSTAN